LTRKVEKLASIEIQSDLDVQEEEDIELKSLFYVGQYLRASVMSTNDEPMKKTNEKGKRRIELSIRPQEANIGITTKELATYSMVMASVISVEDHGLIMDLGLSDSGVRGFMSSKEIGHNTGALTVQEGTVFLCMITGLSSNGKIVKLSADTRKIANVKKSNYLVEGPTVDAFLPGTAVELLITDITAKGITGKVMGMIDVTSDLIHSGAITGGKDLDRKYRIGTKIKGRIICTFPTADPRKLGISLLEHVMSLAPQKAVKDGQPCSPLDVLPLSTIAEEITVKKVEASVGLFVDIGLKDVPGFVHISRVTDGKIDTLSQSTGPYQTGTKHRGRIIGYNAMDGIYLVSLEQKILDQAFLRVEDLKVGELVKGKVERLIVNSGGVLVTLADGITGLVPEMHMADVSLLHPEKKFKEGMNVTARVLSTDPSKRKIRLTLKKSLVNSEAPLIKSYADIAQGMQSPGAIVNIVPSGAVVQFYGTVRGFLPVSEMSESYIQDPSQHFRVGQVVNVHVLTVDVDSGKLTVSCKAPSVFGLAQQNAFNALKIGERLSSTVTSKSNDDVVVELEGSGLQAVLPVGHLTDGSESKNTSAWKKLRVGQSLKNLAILEKHEQGNLIILTNKPSLVKAAENRTLPQDFDDLRVGRLICGFVKNITLTGVFVQFGGSLTGLLPKSKLPDEALHLQDFGFKRSQSLIVRVHSLDQSQRRFLLSIKDLESATAVGKVDLDSLVHGQAVLNPIDDKIESIHDLTLGRLTAARIASIKETQINVQLADNIQGRIDVSQVFDSWDDIKDRKHPLKRFTSKQIVSVRILGIHDARNHRFLPITHRTGKTPVFELSAKPSDQTDVEREVLTLDKIKTGTSWIAFVNNVGDDCLWVNLSPNVRGRIRTLDISDDVALLKDLHVHFPVGSAIKVHVTAVDIANNRLDLSARSTHTTGTLSLDALSQNVIIPGKVTKINERQIMVQLSDNISGSVNLPDLADDFAEANPTIYRKNDVISVSVAEVDAANKRIRLSTRPSRVLNSSLPVKDPEVTSVSQLKVNDIVRGFVKNVADNGLFVNLGGSVTAYVRVSDLSDLYLKDWKASFQVDQLVKGKVILADPIMNHVQLSLKSSVIDKDYVPPITFNDLKVGQVVTGRIRKVEDFGVFIVVDGSANVSGLCHRTEMAEGKVDNVKQLYEEGDAVKVKILKVEPEKRRISFGLKAAYFDHDNDSNQDSDEDDTEDSFRQVSMSNEESGDVDGGVDLGDSSSLVDKAEQGEHISDQVMQDLSEEAKIPSLSAGGFDWAAGILDNVFEQPDGASSDEGLDDLPKKHRRKPVIKVDMTGELDANGPQSVSDFERLLLGQPDSSRLWIEYMAFQTKLGELPKARDVAERALRTINIREEAEKMNIWIALFNIENEYGSDDTMEDTFRRACQYNDPQELHERLTSIYIQTGKHVVSYFQSVYSPDAANNQLRKRMNFSKNW
jgi:rRNA biogenesis protein RRP5